jgi:hypothetical protein
LQWDNKLDPGESNLELPDVWMIACLTCSPLLEHFSGLIQSQAFVTEAEPAPHASCSPPNTSRLLRRSTGRINCRLALRRQNLDLAKLAARGVNQTLPPQPATSLRDRYRNMFSALLGGVAEYSLRIALNAAINSSPNPATQDDGKSATDSTPLAPPWATN